MIVVEKVLGLVTVQDLGRPGRMHEALAPGGALVPELLVAANRRAGNPDGAPAIEVLGRLAVRALVPVSLSTGLARTGELITVESEPCRVAYLALRGGIAAPELLGGRGAQLSAGLGAPLRAGDQLASAALPEVDAVDDDAALGAAAALAGAGDPFAADELAAGRPAGEPVAAEPGAIRLVPGPDHDAFAGDALDRLRSAPYRILPTSDRIGTRLDGPPIPRVAGYVEVSRPMVRGAIEVPRDGAPIVLGPEHPTTGGYPVVAVIAHADLGRFFAIRLGGTVRFR